MVPLQSGSDLLPNGAYGQIQSFDIQTPVDHATAAPDADSVARMGTADVLVSFPAASNSIQDQVRTFTQMMTVEGGSVAMRSSVLENALCWVLNCSVCPAVYLGLNSTVAPQVPTGVPMMVVLQLRNGGECDGAAFLTTIQLPDELKLVSATPDYGSLTVSDNVISLAIGRVPGFQQLNLTLSLIPLVPGSVTIPVHIQAASAAAEDGQASFEVQGDRIPELGIARRGANSVLLNVSAQPGNSYFLQRAVLPLGNSAFVWTTLTNFIFAAPLFQMQDTNQPTNQGSLYRVRSPP